MGYDDKLAERVRALLIKQHECEEKKMFGGITFMLTGKMCCGILKNDLMVRVLPERYKELLRNPAAREMDFTGRPMKGFLFISLDGLRSDSDLKFWIDESLRFIKKTPVKATRKS
ncbi:MAG: TfoX/Sxy family protein [Nitrospirae bacterium]|nr:TfoX/Sxy family protein [Nitrospirota bacterium]